MYDLLRPQGLVVAMEAVDIGVTCMDVEFHWCGLRGAASFDTAVVEGEEPKVDAGVILVLVETVLSFHTVMTSCVKYGSLMAV